MIDSIGQDDDEGVDDADAAADEVFRHWADTVVPLAPPVYGFQQVLARSQRRKARRRMLAATGSVLGIGLVFGGLAVGNVLPGLGSGSGNCGNANSPLAAVVNGAVLAECGNGASAAGLPTGGSGPFGLSATGTGTGGDSVTTPSAPPAASSSGSSGSSPKPVVSSSGSGQTGGVSKCLTSELAMQVSVVDGSQGMGHELLNLTLTNKAGQACSVYGFPGLQLLTDKLSPQPTVVSRDYGITPVTVTLAPGKAASTTIRFDMDIPVGNEPTTGACEPDSYYLEVTAPNNTTHLDPWINTEAGGAGGITVCEHGALDVLPFVAGAVGPNQ